MAMVHSVDFSVRLNTLGKAVIAGLTATYPWTSAVVPDSSRQRRGASAIHRANSVRRGEGGLIRGRKPRGPAANVGE